MTPRDLGFRMPPEWAKHQRTFMEWPIKEADWPEPFIEVQEAFANIVNNIVRFEPVTLIVRPELEPVARKMCSRPVDFFITEHDDSWMRDNGPTFVVNDKGGIAGINWIFTAWGEKFPHEKDNLVAANVLERFNVQRFDVPIVMEGGSIHVDGEGTLLTTEECLLNANRNPALSRNDIENYLNKNVNIDKVIWLKRGLYGDDTDGHIDNVACFAAPGVIVLQVCSNPEDPNYELTLENRKTLQNATDAKGRSFRIIEIEQPEPDYFNDVRLTLSYLNFYFVNGGIILPVFGGKSAAKDKAAKETLQELFSDRTVVTVNGLPIARGGGNVHCLTQQMPAGNA